MQCGGASARRLSHSSHTGPIRSDQVRSGQIGSDSPSSSSRVADTTDFKSFEPQEFVAQGDQVVVIGRYAARMKPSGQSISSGWVMLFTIRNGKVVRFREYTDSAQI